MSEPTANTATTGEPRLTNGQPCCAPDAAGGITASESAHKFPWWSPARVKNTLLRRAALIVIYPAAVAINLGWNAWLTVLSIPFAAMHAAWRAFWHDLADSWSSGGMIVLRRGFWWIWSRQFHEDIDAAMDEAIARDTRQ